jgi:hypothetical protein
VAATVGLALAIPALRRPVVPIEQS